VRKSLILQAGGAGFQPALLEIHTHLMVLPKW